MQTIRRGAARSAAARRAAPAGGGWPPRGAEPGGRPQNPLGARPPRLALLSSCPSAARPAPAPLPGCSTARTPHHHAPHRASATRGRGRAAPEHTLRMPCTAPGASAAAAARRLRPMAGACPRAAPSPPAPAAPPQFGGAAGHTNSIPRSRPLARGPADPPSRARRGAARPLFQGAAGLAAAAWRTRPWPPRPRPSRCCDAGANIDAGASTRRRPATSAAEYAPPPRGLAIPGAPSPAATLRAERAPVRARRTCHSNPGAAPPPSRRDARPPPRAAPAKHRPHCLFPRPIIGALGRAPPPGRSAGRAVCAARLRPGRARQPRPPWPARQPPAPART
jgi:hypothetical protein